MDSLKGEIKDGGRTEMGKGTVDKEKRKGNYRD